MILIDVHLVFLLLLRNPDAQSSVWATPPVPMLHRESWFSRSLARSSLTSTTFSQLSTR